MRARDLPTSPDGALERALNRAQDEWRERHTKTRQQDFIDGKLSAHDRRLLASILDMSHRLDLRRRH